MSRKFNFSAGPSTLPLTVLEKIREDIVDYKGKGLSLIEASHRGKEYEEVHNAAISLTKKLYEVPDNYKILFLAGGATLQFSMIPLNFLPEGKSCDFTLTGAWSKAAMKDAQKVGKVNLVYDGSKDNFAKLPSVNELKLDPNAAFLHLTSNETIHGIQWKEWPNSGSVPMIVDVSSDMLSRRIPWNKIAMAYGGAQKNLGPAGTTMVIIREDLLAKCNEKLTAYLSYKTHAEGNSLYNTPPVFAIWVCKLVLEELDKAGGLKAVEERAEKKAKLIYDAIDSSNGYYRSPVSKDCRSQMNIVWRLPSEELEAKFIDAAKEKGMIGLKGHRSVGGIRASVYNALPIEGAEALAKLMKEFAAKN